MEFVKIFEAPSFEAALDQQEKWLWENKEALESVLKGLAESGAGLVVPLEKNWVEKVKSLIRGIKVNLNKRLSRKDDD